MDVTCQVDTTGLTSGINAAQGYTKRTLPQMVNTSGYWIAVNAKNGLPFVTPEKVDSEMATIVTPKIGKRGKILSQKKAKNKTLSGGTERAFLIVMARTVPGSNYNILTGNRYALPSLKGMSASGFHATIAFLVDQMLKSRHRSGKFLVAGWIPAVRKMLPYTAQRFIRGAGSPLEGARSFFGANLGGATPAMAGGDYCAATIENDVGMEGKNAASFNRALMLYGVPALQAAVDREGTKQMEYALSKFEKELKDETDKHWA
jgi:hypothetical protein